MDSDSREWIYKRYVATSLKIMKDPTQEMGVTLEELIYPAKRETRTAEEIIEDVCAKTGIKIID